MSGNNEIITPAEAVIITPKVSRWAARIGKTWTSGVIAILKTGALLEAARSDCAHGEWQALIGELPFGARHAHRLRALAAYGPFRTHESDLPSDTETLYQLSRLTEQRFEKLLEDEVIHPAMKRLDASAETRAEVRARDRARVANLKPIRGKFKTLVVDPPWDSDWYSPSARHPPYATMTVDEILALPVAGWAEGNCHLYLWTPNNFLPLAVEAMARWDFAHKSVLTWVKPRNGMGHYFRNSTEQVLFGIRGKLKTRADDIPTHFESPVGAHSEKPETFYQIVRRASYPAFGEAFQRERRKDFKDLFEGMDDA